MHSYFSIWNHSVIFLFFFFVNSSLFRFIYFYFCLIYFSSVLFFHISFFLSWFLYVSLPLYNNFICVTATILFYFFIYSLYVSKSFIHINLFLLFGKHWPETDSYMKQNKWSSVVDRFTEYATCGRNSHPTLIFVLRKSTSFMQQYINWTRIKTVS